ncbi:MAG: hypothetical protein PHT94_03140 [Candidatus Nanoarchaeia archaeon]|nr:hypothetical protein [Candidatus Nanoarchaeia archaeon]
MEIKKKDYKNNKNKFKFFTKNNTFTILILISIIFLMFFFTNINSYNPNLKMISGTEYISGEEGQIIIRLEDEKGKSITNAKCIVSLLYPDKSFFFTDREMQQTSIPGNYFVSFITPSREGIYEEHIRCTNPDNSELPERRISSSFHVSSGLNMIREISISQRTEFNNIINMINETNELLKNEINNLKTDIENIEKNINNNNQNFKTEISTLNSNINNIKNELDKTNSAISSSLNNIEKIVKDSQNLSTEKFSQLGEAMINIFK